MFRPTRYLAFGDSMSLDLYPALDAGAIDVAVALERAASAGRVAPLGAASLLYQNADDRWPEDAGRDLVSRDPRITFENLAADGATIGDVFGEQLSLAEPAEEAVLVTLTVGQSDVFSAARLRPRRELLDRVASDIVDAYDFLIETLRGRFPNGLVVLATVCDPSDRTARIPGAFDDEAALPLAVLDRLNEHIRSLAGSAPNLALADAYAHFLGHGVSAPEPDQWYWRRSLVEPNARGASELRHLWLDVLEAAEQT